MLRLLRVRTFSKGNLISSYNTPEYKYSLRTLCTENHAFILQQIVKEKLYRRERWFFLCAFHTSPCDFRSIDFFISTSDVEKELAGSRSVSRRLSSSWRGFEFFILYCMDGKKNKHTQKQKKQQKDGKRKKKKEGRKNGLPNVDQCCHISPRVKLSVDRWMFVSRYRWCK